jgi:glycosyltransferase involved in cell wall biosynthesis
MANLGLRERDTTAPAYAYSRHARIFMTADSVGGIWTYAIDLARELSHAGFDLAIAVCGPPANSAQLADAKSIACLRLIQADVPLDWVAAGAPEVLAAGSRLAALAEDFGADLVHLNSAAYAAGGAFRAPLLVACHSCMASWWEAVEGSALPSDFAWRRDLVAKGYAAANLLVAPSAAFAEVTARLYRLPQVPRVVHNGRSPPASPSAAMALPESFAFTAGRLWDRGKNLAALDRVASPARPILAAGPLTGPQGETLQVSRLQTLGQLDGAALAACCNEAAVFVSPARYEPFGLAILEAAQASCPLLLSDIPSFREIWHDAADYLPTGNDDALGEAIDRMLSDPALRRHRGEAARRRAARYTTEEMARGMQALYAEMQPAIASPEARL